MDNVFKDVYVPNAEGHTYHPKWVRSNPGEAQKWAAFRDALYGYEKGDVLSYPNLTTKYGKALVAAGRLHMSVIDLGAVWEEEPPPPPPPPPEGEPTGYFWRGDMRDDAQNFSDFDMHDSHSTTFTDWAVGSTLDHVIVNKPVGSRYPWSNYSCRIICNNNLPSNSSSGQTVNLWETGAYGAPWTNGNTVWCRVFILIPNGTDPNYPGKLTPVSGDGVDNDFHVIAEWHKNDPVGAPGPTSTKLETSMKSGVPCLIFKPIGGLYGNIRSWYLFETDQVQNQNNGIGAGQGNAALPIGGNVQALQFNHWYDMLFRWRLSPDPNIGEIDWYVDGNLRVSGRFPNMFQKSDGSVPGISFQAGMYRSYPYYGGRPTDTTNENEHIYIGPMLSGPTRASVDPLGV